jgi:hypothetical protein
VIERFDATSKDAGVEGRSQGGSGIAGYGDGVYGDGFYGRQRPNFDETTTKAVDLEGSRGTSG